MKYYEVVPMRTIALVVRRAMVTGKRWWCRWPRYVLGGGRWPLYLDYRTTKASTGCRCTPLKTHDKFSFSFFRNLKDSLVFINVLTISMILRDCVHEERENKQKKTFFTSSCRFV